MKVSGVHHLHHPTSRAGHSASCLQLSPHLTPLLQSTPSPALRVFVRFSVGPRAFLCILQTSLGCPVCCWSQSLPKPYFLNGLHTLDYTEGSLAFGPSVTGILPPLDCPLLRLTARRRCGGCCSQQVVAERKSSAGWLLSFYHLIGASVASRAGDTTMRIACLQFAPQVGDVDNNLDRADSILSRVDPKDLDLLVLPELAFTGKQVLSCLHIPRI